jgi:hypothetical protein
MPLDKGRWANLSAIDEELGYMLEGALTCHLGLLEQRPHLHLACLLRGCEVFVQAQLGPRQGHAPS